MKKIICAALIQECIFCGHQVGSATAHVLAVCGSWTAARDAFVLQRHIQAEATSSHICLEILKPRPGDSSFIEAAGLCGAVDAAAK